MKWLLSFLLSLTFVSAQAFASDLCHFVFRKNETKTYSVDIDKIERINNLEEWSNRFRVHAYKNDPFTPTASRRSEKRFVKVEGKLLAGEAQDALNAYRSLYRRVEGATLLIERYVVLSQAMRKAKELGVRNYRDFFFQNSVVESLASEYARKINTVSDLSRELNLVEDGLRKNFRSLGDDFEAYNYVRLKMDKLVKMEYCSPGCKQAIEEFKNNIGLKSGLDRELYKDLLQGRKGYTLEEVRAIFNSHPDAVLMARKKEFMQEGFALILKYGNDLRLFKRLYSSLSKSALGQKRYLISMFKSIHDNAYLEIDAAIVKRVTLSPGRPSKKMRVAEQETAQLNRERFWMNFSRSTNGADKAVWNELLEHAKTTGSPHYEAMLRAQELGKKLGPIGQTKVKGVKRLIVGVALGIGAWGYFNFNSTDLGNSDDQLLDSVVNPQTSGISDAEEDEPEILVDYLGQEDAQLTEIFKDMYQMDRLLQDEN